MGAPRTCAGKWTTRTELEQTTNSGFLTRSLNNFDIKKNAVFISQGIHFFEMLAFKLLGHGFINLVDETPVTRPPDNIPLAFGIVEVITHLVTAVADIFKAGFFI